MPRTANSGRRSAAQPKSTGAKSAAAPAKRTAAAAKRKVGAKPESAAAKKRRGVNLMSQREYARTRGVSHAAVQKAILYGRIQTVSGKIDPAQADRQWKGNTDFSKPLNSVSGRPGHRRPRDQAPAPLGLDGGDGGDSGEEPLPSDSSAVGYAKARAIREAYQAKLARLEYEERLGLLVNRDEVRRQYFAIARRARDQLLALPERVDAALAAATDRGEVRRILDPEIERICGAMATESDELEEAELQVE